MTVTVLCQTSDRCQQTDITQHDKPHVRALTDGKAVVGNCRISMADTNDEVTEASVALTWATSRMLSLMCLTARQCHS